MAPRNLQQNIRATEPFASREEAMMGVIRASSLIEIRRSSQSLTRPAMRKIEQAEFDPTGAAPWVFGRRR